MPSSANLAKIFRDGIHQHLDIIRQLETQQHAFENAAILVGDALQAGHKVLWCGNGGSAADAQHLATELVGNFRQPRRPLASIALGTNLPLATAVANDFSFGEVFEREVEALCRPGDVVIGISTSGNSRNVCAALQKAQAMRAATIALAGATGGRLAQFADICLRVPSTDTARIQEAHILLGHLLCEWIERSLLAREETVAAEVCQ